MIFRRKFLRFSKRKLESQELFVRKSKHISCKEYIQTKIKLMLAKNKWNLKEIGKLLNTKEYKLLKNIM